MISMYDIAELGNELKVENIAKNYLKRYGLLKINNISLDGKHYLYRK
jgi:hypothetical protein